ncbi:MAG: DUF433 domain-containing protein [Acidobacteria bacterium]|nr:DUF433 domain-containing protein [Acidobacteriota bacterium]
MNTTVETSVVSRSREVMSGAAVFKDTRVLVKTLPDYLAGGHSIQHFLEDFPTVSREQAVEFLREVSHSFEAVN